LRTTSAKPPLQLKTKLTISEEPNTTRHLYGLLTHYLNEHLPVNPVRVVFETEPKP
jgi:hypothetical protein